MKNCHREGTLVEVLSASRRIAPKRKDSKMSLFEKFSTAGNEKADGLTKEGAMLDGGVMGQIRVSTVQQKREEVFAALQYAGCQLSSSGGGMAML